MKNKQNSKIIRLLALSLALIMVCPLLTCCKSGKSGEQTTKNKKNPADFVYAGETILLYDSSVKPIIYVDEADYKQTVRAVGDLSEDFNRVTGEKAAIVNSADALADAGVGIIIGTLGHSELVDSLYDEGIIDVSSIEGEWEAYSIMAVENPTSDLAKAIVIVGSDKRGTIYGTYELSEQIGVSPWYYWADVATEHKDKIELPLETLLQTEKPDVKYRGIFLNDEENFTAWSARFVSKDSPGKPNPGAYAHVFELLLRLKANTLWPAMHAASEAFNKYKNPKTGISYNAELADDYGIVMSASHCEMMLRDNEGEWVSWCNDNQGKYNLRMVGGSWYNSYDYTVNAEAMNAYWEERVAENYRFENIYMIGLRGVHDSGINCSALSDTSYRGKATVVKKAVQAQLKILEKYEKKYEEETGEAIKFQTAYCVYKEAAEYFKYDIGLPSDTCLMYADDNHGYVRSVVSEEDLEKYESFGMYYHVSYWGRPASYLWLSNTPLPIIAEEMRKCYYTGNDDMWVLNVGDIKPGELKVEYFMDLSWDVDSHTENNTEEYTTAFLQQNFGFDSETSKMFASSLTDFYQMMRNYYPEIVDKHQNNNNNIYSVVNYGSEGMKVINRLTEIYNQSLALYNSLPDANKDAFYEIFHYTIYSYLLIIEKHVYWHMNELCYSQGRYAAANIYADLSETAHQKVLDEVEYYNKKLAGGKWNKIMNPYNSAIPMPEGAPDVKRASSGQAIGKVGFAVEGQTLLTDDITLKFGSLNDNIRFMDIFSMGSGKQSYAFTAPSYIIITDKDGNRLTGTANGTYTIYEGTVEVEERYLLTIDWERFAAGETKEDVITLSNGESTTQSVKISATKHKIDPSKEETKGYYEENGLVSIEAEHYTANVANSGFEWKYIDGLGRSGGVMMALSQSDTGFVNKRLSLENASENSPYLEYKIYFTNTGLYYGTFFRLPTLNESAQGRSYCSTAWSLDGAPVSHLAGTTTADDADHSAWGNMIKMHIEQLKMNITIDEPGWHTIRIYMVNSMQAFDNIVFNQDPNVTSRLSAPETFNTVSWTRAGVGTLPETSLDNVKWVKYSSLLDFTSDTGALQSGYARVSQSKGSLESNGWEWEDVGALKAYVRTVSKSPTVDNGFVYGDSQATLKLRVPANSKFSFTVSVGDPAGTLSASNMRITSGSDILLDNINVSGKKVYHYAFVASSGDDGIISLTFSGTSWIVGSLEIYEYVDTEVSGNAFTADANGNIIIDVEAALEQSEYASTTESTDGKGFAWSKAAGIYGGAMFFGPNTGSSYSSTSVQNSQTAKMNFTVDVPKSGTYSIWALIKCSGLDDDSIIMSIGGKGSFVKNDLDATDGFVWIEIGTYAIGKGETILTVMGREDGMAIDRIILHPETSSEMGYDSQMCRK